MGRAACIFNIKALSEQEIVYGGFFNFYGALHMMLNDNAELKVYSLLEDSSEGSKDYSIEKERLQV
jgi:hypothetical protein